MSMRVLIADEHVTFREFLKSFCPGFPSFKSRRASDGLEAVELVARLKPDLVLMDIEMPRMDGLEARDELRLHHDGTTVFLLSAVADEAHRQAATEAERTLFSRRTPAWATFSESHRAQSQGKKSSSQAASRLKFLRAARQDVRTVVGQQTGEDCSRENRQNGTQRAKL